MFIDMHLHVAGDCRIPYEQGGEVFASPEELIEMLDLAGIDKGVIMPMISPEATMLVQSNESMLAIADKYPDLPGIPERV